MREKCGTQPLSAGDRWLLRRDGCFQISCYFVDACRDAGDGLEIRRKGADGEIRRSAAARLPRVGRVDHRFARLRVGLPEPSDADPQHEDRADRETNRVRHQIHPIRAP